jgi:hypothetical protein
MEEKKFNDKDFLINLRDVMKQMQGGLTKEIEKRVDRLKNIHEEYGDVLVQAKAWHTQEKEREAKREQTVSDRQKQYAEAEKLAEEYGRR